MTDLNDFFAKKDRKKKRTATKSTQATVSSQHDKSSQGNGFSKVDSPVRGNGSSNQPNASDDGWIEIEDPRGSQVHTGGRTVVEMKRDAEEKDASGENSAHPERFSGWGKSDSTADGQEGEAAAEVEAPSPAFFPSLADAAKIPTVIPEKKTSGTAYVPPSGSRSGFDSSSAESQQTTSGSRSRPRFKIDTDKMRRNLADRGAAPSSGS